jgi:transcriptional regulator with GAF, ATPase, and Fis domain
LADGGTLFLDEIGDLDPDLQAKLLRVLQEGEFEQIGSAQTREVDVRIVAATNRDLTHAMQASRFRPDLYYRLAVFPVEVPPLRSRRDDIPLLVWHFITKKQGRLGKTIESIPEHVMQTLVQYDWPGNIRELENVIERAIILATGATLSLPGSFQNVPQLSGINPAANREKFDRAAILATLETCRWRIKGCGNAAERLGLKPSTLRYRMKVLGIQRPATGHV